MNNKSWRGTILFTVILVVMGGTVGLKLYGLGTEDAISHTAVHATAATPSPFTPSTSAAPTSPDSSRIITGAPVDTRYGAVQVKVTFSGSTITAVDTLQAPDHGRRDIQINEQALPILAQEVLASQSANIDTVSGATYTSDGYRQSLQSAIDQR